MKRAVFAVAGLLIGATTLLTEAPRMADQQEGVTQAPALGNDADLKAHLEKAAMVCAGRVEQVRPAELTSAPARPKRITEHDPDWQEAIIEVQNGIKGAEAGERVVVRFPGSRDVAWVGTPTFVVGQEGTFLLHRDSTTGSPYATWAGRSVPAYTALHKIDVLPKQDTTRVRALLRNP